MNEQIKLQQLKFFMYCRKSTDSEDRQVASLPAQIKELTDIKRRENLNIVEVYEESHSAFHPGRPKFNEMMERMENGEANGVLAWSSNRVARNSLDGGRFIYLMDSKKIMVLKTKGGTFFNTPDDKFTLSIDFSVAKKSSDDLSAVVQRGNKHKFFEKREWSGMAKPGYLNVTDNLTKEKKLIPDSDRFNLIKDALRLMIYEGYTPMEAHDVINNQWGYTTRRTLRQGGNPMSRTTWYDIIKDPYYSGLIIRNIEGKKEEIMGTHDTMITPDEFERLQIRLGRKGRSHYDAKTFPFKELLVCGGCGGNMTVYEHWYIKCPKCKEKFLKGKLTSRCPNCGMFIEEMRNPKFYHYIHFECINKKKRKGCTQRTIPISVLYETIKRELQKFEIPEAFQKWAIKYIHELNDDEDKRDTQVKENIQKQYVYIDQQLKNLVKLRISPEFGSFSQDRKEMYDQEEKELINKKNLIKDQFDKVDKQQEQWIKSVKEVFDFAYYAREKFNNGDVKTKTYILSKLGSNFLVNDRKLLIDGKQAYFLVEKGKKEMLEIANEFEPRKYSDLEPSMLSIEAVRNSWRRGRDSNPRWV